jgi:hypothetical protein
MHDRSINSCCRCSDWNSRHASGNSQLPAGRVRHTIERLGDGASAGQQSSTDLRARTSVTGNKFRCDPTSPEIRLQNPVAHKSGGPDPTISTGGKKLLTRFRYVQRADPSRLDSAAPCMSRPIHTDAATGTACLRILVLF